MNSATRRLAWSVFVPCAVLSGTGVYGQETQRDNVTLEEIIVTAQKREERLLDVPLSISAFTDVALQDSGAAQLADFLESAPGVGIIDDQSGTQSIQIRGISSQFGNATVGYYLDELPFTFLGNTPAVDVRTFDLERVEVLRGPQGTLYGEGSIGGTIRILTKEPDLNDFQAAVDLTAMDTADGEEGYGAKGMLNVPLKEDTVGLRLVASKEELGGWVDNTALGTQDQNDRDIDTYRAKLRFAPGEKLDVVLSAWHSESNTDENSGSLPDRTTSNPDLEKTRDEFDLYSVTVRYTFGAFDLVSATSYMDYTNELDSTITVSLAPPLIFPFTIDNEHEITTEELRLTSNSDGIFRWTGGVFYREIERDTIGDFPSFGIRQVLAFQSESYAVFGEGTWSFFDDQLDLTLGLRYFEDELQQTEQVSPANLAEIRARIDPDFNGTSSTTVDSTNPRFNLAFHPNEDWMIYTNIAKGFRTGGVVPAASLLFAIRNNLTIPTRVTPETMWSYEVGTKGSLAGGRVTLEGAVYYNDWEDVQVIQFVSLNPPFRTLINGGKGEVRGVELAAAFQPAAGLTLRLSGGYADSEYTQTVPGTNIREGDRITQVPETTLSGTATYRWPLVASLKGFVHGGVQYTSDRTNVVDLAMPSDETTVLDLRVGVESERWGVYLFGDNLTDEDGAIEASPLPDVTRYRPRTYGLNLRYDFN